MQNLWDGVLGGEHMPSTKTQLDKDRLDRVVAEARRNRQQREQAYREQALKIYRVRLFCDIA